MASFATVEAAGAAVASVIAAGIIPAGLELMDQRMTAVAEDYVHAGYDLDAAAILLCESDGTPEEVEEEIGRVIEVLDAERRHAHRGEPRRGSSACGSGAGARTRFPPRAASAPTTCAWIRPFRANGWPRCCARSKRWKSSIGLRCVNVFHAGDGNLHPLILFDANDADELQPLRAVRRGDPRDQRASSAARSRANTASAWRSSIRCACNSRPPSGSICSAVKRAFDPPGLLNPGKVIPTLQRCAEYGKMHVHRGSLPFPGAAEILMRPPQPAHRSGCVDARARCAPLAARRLEIVGGGTKAFYGEPPRGEPLETAASSPASSATSRANSWSPRAPARRSRELEAALAERGPVPAIRAAALRRRRHRRRHGRGRPVGPGARARPGRVRDFVLGRRCSTGAARCSTSAARS